MKDLLYAKTDKWDPVFLDHMTSVYMWFTRFETLSSGGRNRVKQTMLLMTEAACPQRQPWVYAVQGAADGTIYRGKMLTRSEVLNNLRIGTRIERKGGIPVLVGRIAYAPAHEVQSWTTQSFVALKFGEKSYGGDQMLSCILRHRIDSGRVVIGDVASNLIAEMFGQKEHEVVYLGGKETVDVLIDPYKIMMGAFNGVPFADDADMQRRIVARYGNENAAAIYANPEVVRYMRGKATFAR